MFRKPVLVITTALAVACPLAGAQATATGATAARVSAVTLLDPSEDVWVWSEGSSTWELWGAKENADSFGANITHGPKVVEVVETFDNLRRRGHATYVATIKTKRLVRTAWVYADSETGWGGAHRLTKGTGMDEVDASGFKHEIDYHADTVTFRVPRDLLKNPKWVKVMLRNELDGSHLYTDNPHNDTAQPVYAGRLFTG